MPRKPKPPTSVSQAGTKLRLGGYINDKCVFVVRAVKTRYGKRSIGKRRDVQFALIEIFNNRQLLQDVSNWNELTRQVNAILKRDYPIYYEDKNKKHKGVDRETVKLAYKDLCRPS